MTLENLKQISCSAIEQIKDHGLFPKENDLFDYKYKLHTNGEIEPHEIFLSNFGKDILSFSNSNGGIVLLGIKENKETGKCEDSGLENVDLDILEKIDLNLIIQKFEKIAKVGVSLDLQQFQLGTRKFYKLLIEKQNQILIPINDFKKYNINKGEVIYRGASKNHVANISSQEFNRFLQLKANEKNKEFMEIWSKLLPEMFEINPRDILIINPNHNKVYGFNGKDGVLSSSNIDIDKSESGVFNIILQAISAGEIGKISDTEGKPIYKIVGEIKSSAPRDFIYLTTLVNSVKSKANYNVSSLHAKMVFKHLGWVTTSNFTVENPADDVLVSEFNQFIWLETLDALKKVVVSKEAIEPLVEVINNVSLHVPIFNKSLNLKK